MTPRPGTLGDLFERGMRPFFAPPGGSPLPQLPRGLDDFASVWTAFLEFRLGGSSDAVDLSWCQLREGFSVPAAIAATEPWKTMTRFGERWRRGAPEISAVRAIVYEIDQEGAHGFGPRPAVYFHRIKAGPSAILALCRALGDMLGLARPPGVEAALGRVLRAAPPGSVPLSLGCMLSRPEAPLRYVVSEIEALTALPDHLRAIGWPGDVAGVRRVLAALPCMTGHLHPGPSIDVGEEIGPRLGIEFTFRNPSDRARLLPAILDELAAAGLCLPAYRRTLDAWTDESPLSGWLRALSPQPGFHRVVSHFKLVFDGPAVEAKCYLECMPATMVGASRRREQPSALGAVAG